MRQRKRGPGAESSNVSASGPSTRAEGRNEGHDVERYIRFSLAGIDYIVPINGVVDTGRPPAITPVPNMPMRRSVACGANTSPL